MISQRQQRQVLPRSQLVIPILGAGHQEVTVPAHVGADPLLVIGDIEEDDRARKPVPVQIHGGAEIGLGYVGDVVNPLKS